MDDCCEHFDEETGDLKPEFHAEAEAKAKAEAEYEAKMVEQWAEEERLAEEYWRTYRE